MYSSAQQYFRRVAGNFALLAELSPVIDEAVRGQKVMFCGMAVRPQTLSTSRRN
jgi:hypothetical protein